MVPELPDSFPNILPAFFTKKNPPPRPQNHEVKIDPDISLLGSQLELEYEWLEKVSVTDGALNVTPGRETLKLTLASHHFYLSFEIQPTQLL